MKFYYVYILQSQKEGEHFYVGSTYDVQKRLKDHNEGKSSHTQKYIPWKIKNFFGFIEKEKGLLFEKYLKSSSGRAFSKKHF